jgi:L-iditol 2-dehydrogenase
MVCTPRSEAIAGAAAAVAPGGAVCLYAPPAPDSPLAIDGNAVFMRELEVTASWSAGPADMREAFALLARGTVDPLELVTHRFPLEQTGAALAAQRSGEALKAVVLP